MLRPAFPIETTRLSLRPLTVDDFDDVFAYDSRPDVARYLYWQPRDRGESRAALERHTSRTSLEKEGDGLVLGMVWRDPGTSVDRRMRNAC